MRTSRMLLRKRRADDETKRRGLAAGPPLLLCIFGCLVAMCAPAPAWAQDDVLGQVAAHKFGESRASLRELEERVREVAGDEAARAALAEAMARKLAGEATVEGKRFLCRQLAIVGDGASVPALAGALREDEVAQMAVYALARIEAPEAAAALREGLAELERDARIGAIIALGDKRDSASFRAIAAAGREGDPALRAAALGAIGRIADENVARAMRGMIVANADLDDQEIAAATVDAALLCAEGRLEAGDADGAWRLYELVAEQAERAHVRTAAIRGLVLARGAAEAARIARLLGSDDELMGGFAARLVVEAPGEAFTTAMAGELERMPDELKPALLEALARRGDGAASSAIEALLDSGDQKVRDAAILALGALGDGDSVRAIVRSLDEDGPSGAALDALGRLRDRDANGALAAAIDDASESSRVIIARALAVRRAFGQADALTPLLSVESGAARGAAMEALAAIGSSRHIGPLAAVLREGSPSPAAERALAAIVQRSEDSEAATERLIMVFDGEGAEGRRALIRALGRIGTDRAFGEIVAGLDDRELRDTALDSLVHAWADDRALPPLFAIAADPSDDNERDRAVAGLLRIVDNVTLREPSVSAAHYRRLAGMAESTRERLGILRGITRVSDPGVLPIAIGMFDDPELGADARNATISIAGRLGREHRLDALAALEEVREGGSDALRSACDRAQDHVERDLDFITSWAYAGPYRTDGVSAQDLIPHAFAPETGDRAVNWSELRPTDPDLPGRFDLAERIGGGDRCVYVRTEMWAPQSGEIRLEIGSDDGVKAWIDGDVVLENNAMRGFAFAQDVVEVDLERGWHTLMLKVSQGGGGWEFACRVRGADGLHIPGFRAVARPQRSAPPVGARILFDGRDDSAWMHPGGGEPSWEIERGRMTVRPGAGPLVTREPIEDGLLYVEFMTSRHAPEVRGQARGNSGVYLQGRYEIQVLDSWGEAPADNRCAGIYSKKAPDAAVASRPGEWQTYLIDFTQPRWSESGEKVASARLTVWHNGVLVHDDVEVDSATGAGNTEGTEPGPLLLQDHGNPVGYGRIWYRPRPVAWEGPGAAGFTSLIRSGSLDGWVQRGGEAAYSIENGEIVGETRPNQPNSFLCTEAMYDDFVLELEFMVDPEINSGVQIRSNSEPGYQNGRIHGYQVEIDPSARSWSGGIYDEARRGWLADLSQNEAARAAFRPGEWNQLRVVSRGPEIQTFLNGVPCAELRDDMTARGFVALQVHGVGDRTEPLRVRWRDIRIRELD